MTAPDVDSLLSVLSMLDDMAGEIGDFVAPHVDEESLYQVARLRAQACVVTSTQVDPDVTPEMMRYRVVFERMIMSGWMDGFIAGCSWKQLRQGNPR